MEIICIDTNLLIDYFRKKDKSKTRLRELSHQFEIAIPSIVAYEYLRGQDGNAELDDFLNQLTSKTSSLAFDLACAQKAADIWLKMKPLGRSMETEDLLIAAISLTWGYRLATNNRKHFDHIPDIQLL